MLKQHIQQAVLSVTPNLADRVSVTGMHPLTLVRFDGRLMLTFDERDGLVWVPYSGPYTLNALDDDAQPFVISVLNGISEYRKTREYVVTQLGLYEAGWLEANGVSLIRHPEHPTMAIGVTKEGIVPLPRRSSGYPDWLPPLEICITKSWDGVFAIPIERREILSSNGLRRQKITTYLRANMFPCMSILHRRVHPETITNAGYDPFDNVAMLVYADQLADEDNPLEHTIRQIVSLRSLDDTRRWSDTDRYRSTWLAWHSCIGGRRYYTPRHRYYGPAVQVFPFPWS